MTMVEQRQAACLHPEIACRQGALGLLYRFLEQPLIWQERWRERQHLANLPDYLLRDIGLNRSQVDGETGKWFWQR